MWTNGKDPGPKHYSAVARGAGWTGVVLYLLGLFVNSRVDPGGSTALGIEGLAMILVFTGAVLVGMSTVYGGAFLRAYGRSR